MFIDSEVYGHFGLEKIPEKMKKLKGLDKQKIYCDNSAPDKIAYCQKHGLNTVAARKGAGSIEHGIDFIRSWDVIIDSSCENLIYEFSTYSYKRDKQTNEITSIIIDKNNHGADSVRYACSEMISASLGGNNETFAVACGEVIPNYEPDFMENCDDYGGMFEDGFSSSVSVASFGLC